MAFTAKETGVSSKSISAKESRAVEPDIREFYENLDSLPGDDDKLMRYDDARLSRKKRQASGLPFLGNMADFLQGDLAAQQSGNGGGGGEGANLQSLLGMDEGTARRRREDALTNLMGKGIVGGNAIVDARRIMPALKNNWFPHDRQPWLAQRRRAAAAVFPLGDLHSVPPAHSLLPRHPPALSFLGRPNPKTRPLLGVVRPSRAVAFNALGSGGGGIYGVGSPTIGALGHHPDTRHHKPDSPKFHRLISSLQPIIPNNFNKNGQRRKLGNPLMMKNKEEEEKKKLKQEEQEVLFLRNVLQMLGKAVPKMRDEGPAGEDRLQLLEKVENKAKTILTHIDETGSIPKKNMSELVVLFNKAFQELPEQEKIKSQRQFVLPALQLPHEGKRAMRAPFCKAGQDCFEDVSHAKLAVDIKRLALALHTYMRDRVLEENGSPVSSPEELHRKTLFATDAVLTQATTLIAKMHRAIMMNWQQMRMLLSNLAGEEPNSIKSAKGFFPETALKPDTAADQHQFFKCELDVGGEGEAFQERPHWCRAGRGWFKDDACVSPIADPSSQCSPQEDAAVYFQKVHGQFALKIPFSGEWDFIVKAAIKPSPQRKPDQAVDGEHIRGSVDKITDKNATHPGGIQTLAVLDQTAKFPKAAEKGTKVYMEAAGSAKFRRGERLLLRTAMSREDLHVVLTVRFNPRKTKNQEEGKMQEPGKQNGETVENEVEAAEVTSTAKPARAHSGIVEPGEIGDVDAVPQNINNEKDKSDKVNVGGGLRTREAKVNLEEESDDYEGEESMEEDDYEQEGDDYEDDEEEEEEEVVKDEVKMPRHKISGKIPVKPTQDMSNNQAVM